jgi:hypothetical protein
MNTSDESPLNAALRQFEVVEANLHKAERVLEEVVAAIPSDVAFVGDDPQYAEYDNNCRAFDSLLSSLPSIDGWKPDIVLMELDAIAQNRLDALELGEFEVQMAVEQDVSRPARQLREYRYRFDTKRRELVRRAVLEHIDSVDEKLARLSASVPEAAALNDPVDRALVDSIQNDVDQIDMLLGGSVTKPPRWSDLQRHLSFGQVCDASDIVKLDWPAVKGTLWRFLYSDKEPVPIEVEDLGGLVAGRPEGPVATKLNWERLSDEDFERLIFSLISSEASYENPEWLTRTDAPDRGRDLSVYRVFTDPLSGTTRQRVIIQCRHWLTRSVGPSEVSLLRDQMKLWEPPAVDVHVIATSGRFTTDAIALVEKHNQSDSRLKIEMWPESHLERLLARRPSIIGEFRLR